MVLDKYKQKRNFSSTPEPAGDVAVAAARAKSRRPADGLFFCVQKHLASHLHYDFRLEFEGVLLSWAVPKGPSLDPGTKRLAMHVEDHPIEYGTFEGVIPEGYGAGIVMLWDQGTWKPEVEDVAAALKKGDLKFTLDGFKLKGSWVLVRTGGRWGSRSAGGDARSWLLIKHRDDWAGDVDITEFAPLSVKSRGDLEDILAADHPDVWQSNRPAKGGEAGAMLAAIIDKVAKVKAGARPDKPASGTGRAKGTTRPTASAGAKTTPKARARTGAKTTTKSGTRSSTGTRTSATRRAPRAATRPRAGKS
ncbi:MAG: DNA polymerase ligase N-terminal domain-containing protein [Acidobacteriota bacterium]